MFSLDWNGSFIDMYDIQQMIFIFCSQSFFLSTKTSAPKNKY